MNVIKKYQPLQNEEKYWLDIKFHGEANSYSESHNSLDWSSLDHCNWVTVACIL